MWILKGNSYFLKYAYDLTFESEMGNMKGMNRSYLTMTVGKNHTDFHVFFFLFWYMFLPSHFMFKMIIKWNPVCRVVWLSNQCVFVRICFFFSGFHRNKTFTKEWIFSWWIVSERPESWLLLSRENALSSRHGGCWCLSHFLCRPRWLLTGDELGLRDKTPSTLWHFIWGYRGVEVKIQGVFPQKWDWWRFFSKACV